MCASGVRHTVEKLLRRAKSLLWTSTQLEVYELTKSRESKLRQFRKAEFRDKKSFGCRCRKETQRILYAEGGGFPRARAVVSIVSQELLWVCFSTKGAPECELTNLLVGFE